MREYIDKSNKVVKLVANDLFSKPLEQTEVDFENEGGETYLCGNPQFKGARKQTKAQKEDMSLVFYGHKDFKDCDYVSAWFLKVCLVEVAHFLLASSQF